MDQIIAWLRASFGAVFMVVPEARASPTVPLNTDRTW
jgi:hypothetical protein